MVAEQKVVARAAATVEAVTAVVAGTVAWRAVMTVVVVTVAATVADRLWRWSCSRQGCPVGLAAPR